MAAIRRLWAERHRFAGERIVQYMPAIFHLRRSTLRLATCAHQFSKETAHGRIELDEFGCTNGNQYVLARHGNESIKYQLRWFLRRESQPIQIGTWNNSMARFVACRFFAKQKSYT